MPATTPTFVFDDDGKAYAYVAGKIVAAADDADELEAQLQRLDTESNPVVAKDNPFAKKDEDDGDDKKKKGNPFAKKDDEEKESAVTVHNATHVTTPNGLKGTILGKQRGLWGDQVTIRLENGRIAKFDVSPESKVTYSNENKVGEPYPTMHTFVAFLQERLDRLPDGTKASLTERLGELKAIKNDGSAFIRNANVPYLDGETVDNIIVQADYELREVTDALSALEDAEPYAAPAPFSTGVQEQEAMGGGDSSWLDHAVDQMVTENEGRDFDTLLEEGPETFVAELETPVLQDEGVTQQYADEFVSANVAGLDKAASAEYRTAFLARVASAREVELTSRAEARETIAKQAAAEDNDGEAEGLFW